MPIALAADPSGCLWIQRSEAGEPMSLGSLDQARESLQRLNERWILASTAGLYPRLLEVGVRLTRCHDIELTEALLLGASGEWGAPRTLAAAYARLHRRPLPPETGVGSSDPALPALFDRPEPQIPDVEPTQAIFDVYADQQRRSEIDPKGAAFGLVCAADSAGALLAVEMTRAGIPWDIGVHNEILTELLGDRTPAGVRPAKLAALAEQVQAAFAGRVVNPDSPADVLAAFARDGVQLESTRSWVIRDIEHPAVKPLLAYKELSRIHTANGWAWQTNWIRDSRLRPEYVPGGVVSGRWATRGGGALQIPRRLRAAVIADPGRILVVADAAQLEPRILAAMSRDPGMARAAGEQDMYAALAAESFGGQRDRAKIGLLGAMYGQVAGTAAAPLAVLRQRYPRALNLLEEAAWAGERGQLVRSHLGRTCPPSSLEDPTPAQRRSRGRFTRNFVVQATAAEWAESLLAVLRGKLWDAVGDRAEIVFYQHDEVMVHADADLAQLVIDTIEESAAAATRLLFGPIPVRFPLHIEAAKVYADAH